MEFYKHDLLFLFTILLIQQERPPRKYCYQSSEIYCLQKYISIRLGYRTVNASKYMRCARTFYFHLVVIFLIQAFLGLPLFILPGDHYCIIWSCKCCSLMSMLFQLFGIFSYYFVKSRQFLQFARVKFYTFLLSYRIRRRGVVGRVPAFQPGGPDSIPGGIRNFNFCPGIGCVFFVFCPVLSLAEVCSDHTFKEARPCVYVQQWQKKPDQQNKRSP